MMRILYVDGLPLISARLLPGEQTILIYNNGDQNALTKFCSGLLADCSPLRVLNLQKLW